MAGKTGSQTIRRAGWMTLVAALASASAHAAGPAPAASEIGTTVVAQREVTGTLGTEQRPLKQGSRVHRSELLRTGAQSQAELKLDDNTKLALGPNSELRLDETVVPGASGDTKSFAIKFIKGAFRFITGDKPSETYSLETPTASIGVRGTVFDIFIDVAGGTLVLLHDGAVEVCTAGRVCQAHREVGYIVRTTSNGVVSEPVRWTAGLLPGLAVASAFPFVGRRLVIDPVRRLRYATLTSPVVGTVRAGTSAVRAGASTVRRTIRRVTPF